MPIYKLTPVDPESRNWLASTHKSECTVRAKNETRARNAAQLAFMQAVGIRPGETIPVSPWTRPGEVACASLADHNYEEDGPETVLDPPGAHPKL